jgi:hypothetical protein
MMYPLLQDIRGHQLGHQLPFFFAILMQKKVCIKVLQIYNKVSCNDAAYKIQLHNTHDMCTSHNMCSNHIWNIMLRLYWCTSLQENVFLKKATFLLLLTNTHLQISKWKMQNKKVEIQDDTAICQCIYQCVPMNKIYSNTSWTNMFHETAFHWQIWLL